MNKPNKTSAFNLFQRGFKMSLQNLWRNKGLSLATIFVMGIIIFIFNVILSINTIAQNSIENLSKKIDIIVYLKENTELNAINMMQNDLLNLEGINNVEYVSKEEALAKMQASHPDLSVAFEKYSLGNPLPASLNITTSAPEYHQTVAEFLSQDMYKKYLSNIITSDPTNNAILSSVSENLYKLSNFTQQIIFWLVITFVIGGALIILNALQMAIFSRRKEIQIMELVGAPLWFIKLPFVLESIIYGFLAVILGFGMIIVVSNQVGIVAVNSPNLFALEIIVTIALSIFSSLIAVNENHNH